MQRETRTRIGNWRDRLLGHSFTVLCATDLPKQMLGSTYGAHCVCTRGLSRDSVVYSIGVGEDISFDLGLIHAFGGTIHGFDPTPRALAFVQQSGPPEGFVMHAFGLAARDGMATFYPPADPEHVSHSLLARASSPLPAIAVEMRRLSTIMRELGHAHIDVLKMDIEGEEYAVIDQMLEEQIEVRQLLVEFHHQFKTVGLCKTRDTVSRLERAGYRVFDISPNGREFSFIL